jgi:phage terminase large subunit GpA-like protein
VDISTTLKTRTDLEPLSERVGRAGRVSFRSSFAGTGTQTFRIQCVVHRFGYLTTRVYKFCKRYAAPLVRRQGNVGPVQAFAVKADDVGKNPKVRLFPIGTNAAKDEVFAALKTEKPGPSYCHFPDRSRTPRTPT